MTVDTVGWLLVLAGVGAAGYLAWCAWFPYARCWWRWCPRNTPAWRDGRGHYRRRHSVCPICGNRDYRRLGARLIGAGRD